MPSVYYGQNSDLNLVSQTHGRFTLAFVESLEADVQHTNKRLYFFNNKTALAISIFEGAQGRFGFLATDEKYLLAAIGDISPSGSGSNGVINNDPGAYYPFDILSEVKNEAGTIEKGMLVLGCRVAGIPSSMAPREEQHGTCNYIANTKYEIQGGGIQYARFISSAPAYSTADDIAISGTGPFSGTLAHSATEINIINNSTYRTYLAIKKNGSDISNNTGTDLSGFSITADQVVFPTGAFANTTDVWEIYTAYTPS